MVDGILKPKANIVKSIRPKPLEIPAVFSWDLQPGDIINFVGDDEIEVSRDRTPLGRCRYQWCDGLKKVVQEGTRVQGSLIPGMERREYSVKGGQVTSRTGKKWSTEQGSKPTKLRPKEKPAEAKVGTPKKSSDLPPNARWITIHPHGDDEKGQPILIQERPDGTAVVIAGAGGSLNQLQLGKLSSPQKWKQRSQERSLRRAEKERNRQENQSPEERQAESQALASAKEHHTTARHENAKATLEALEKHGLEHGLTAEHKAALSNPPAPGAEEETVKQWKRLTREATDVAKRVQQAYEHKLVTDHEARAAARLGDISLSDIGGKLVEGRDHMAADLEGNELSSLIQLPDGRWLVRGEGEADKVFKNWADAAREHVGNVNQAENGGARTQPDEFYSSKDWVREPKDEKLPEGFTFKPEAAIAFANLSNQRKEISRSARQAVKDIKQGGSFQKQSFDIGPVTDTSISALDDLERDAKTLEDAISNNDLLSLVDMVDAKGLKKHLNFGGYAKLAEISSDILKQNTIDPQVVEALGHGEAAKVLAFTISQNVSPEEYKRISAAQSAYHAQMSSEIARQAVEEAQPLIENLSTLHDQILQLEAQKGEGYTPEQLMLIDNLNYQARTIHDTLQKQVGSVVGQLQASAAMSLALEVKPRALRFAAKGDLEDASSLIPETWGADSGEKVKPSIWDGYGMKGEDFELEDGPEGQLVTIKESGLKKITNNAYSADDKEAYEKAIAIKRGDFDEDFFVPNGFAHRLKHTYTDYRGESTQFDTRLSVSSDMDEAGLRGAVMSYIGARVANGNSPLDVRSDVFSPGLYLDLGIDPETADRVREAVNTLDKELISGRRVSDSAVIKAYQDLGNAEAAKQRRARKTDDLEALHNQQLDPEHAVEAAHRTLAAMPMARAAMKPMDQLNPQERRHLREYAITEIMGMELERPTRSSVPKPDDEEEQQFDIFGNSIAASEVAAKQRDDETPNFTQWQQFTKIMGGDDKAYEAVRDKIRGQFVNRFAAAYGGVAGQQLMIGEQKQAHIERQLLAQLSESQRNEMLEFIRSREQSDVAKVRSRLGGKFATELDPEWLNKLQDIRGDNRQISLLASDTGRTDSIDWQRTTLGQAAESQLDQVLERVIPGFEQVSNPVKLHPEVNFAGDFIAHQRGLKFLQEQKKIGMHWSAGAGKSSGMLSAFSHLHGEGKVKRSWIAVPSGVIGQMIGECSSFLEPGKHSYSGNLGWDRGQRLQALSDGSLGIHITTRESLSNDLLHLVERHTGVTPDQFQNEQGVNDEERRDLMGKALAAEGIDPKDLLLSVDEAHDIARRQGVQASKRSLALDALAYHSGYYLHATGTPLKNDLSEMHDFLRKVAPDKFRDRQQFMAKYGQDTEASKRALQRITAQYAYAVSVKPKAEDGTTLEMQHHTPKIQLSDHQVNERAKLIDDYKKVRSWYSQESSRVLQRKRNEGQDPQIRKSDFVHAWDDPEIRDAIANLAGSDYEGMDDEARQRAIGGQVMASAALKNTALNRLYHRTPFEHNPKAQHLVSMAEQYAQQGKSGVIFSASSEAAAMLRDEMTKRGLRVGVIDGSLSAEQKSDERIKFSPAEGEADYDVLVATDAAQTGLNLQRGKWLAHFDVPLTQKAWDQRSARIYRRGQTEDVEVHTLLGDTPEEKMALARLQRKAGSSRVFQGYDFSRGHSEVLDDTGLAGEIERRRMVA